MTVETAERASQILKYIEKSKHEIQLWEESSGIKHVVLNNSLGPITIEGTFKYGLIKHAQITFLNDCIKQWELELKEL